jgi:phosphatidylserine decarboxylase
MKIRVEKGGIPFISGGGLLFLILAGSLLFFANEILFTLACLTLIFTVFMIVFFRDPERNVQPNEGEILSPADGTIVEINHFSEEVFVKKNGQKVSIFLSILDPHINRSPVEGIVKQVQYRSGKFHPAFLAKASKENEQNIIGIETSKDKILVKQIAGTVARRVVSYVREGQHLKSGEKIGLIRFGSRVELFLPEDVQLKVNKGDRVKAGMTIIGKFPIQIRNR